jgi:hypothetical protein
MRLFGQNLTDHQSVSIHNFYKGSREGDLFFFNLFLTLPNVKLGHLIFTIGLHL